MQITRDLKVGDKFRHVEYGECVVVPPRYGSSLPTDGAVWFARANGERLPTQFGKMWTSEYKNNTRFLELTDEPNAATLDAPEPSIYPPWLDTASTKREM